eukprot:CAMPEP_0184487566 /NCGR_PEP_ID=MMETSP0113_2-20130426/10196_1 /TAXON_ID=91329 /ORGANISM="Norrisiella sphaerica, Strain BC52" /LENGTH=222 /DNA_ID=CAMNT_0026869921 /DNA_START=143 /DNA_END=811 /DNA_ORIENTATION=+
MPGLGGGLRSVFSNAPPVIQERRLEDPKPVYRSISGLVSQNGDLMAYAPRVADVRPRPLPPFYEHNTSFSSSRPASQIYRALKAALVQYSTTAKPEKAKIKGSASIMGAQVNFQVHIFEKPNGEGHLVEFQRRSGDSCGFWYLFREAMESLSADLADAESFLNEIADDSRFELYKKVWKKEPTKLSIDSDFSSQVADMLSKTLTFGVLRENKAFTDKGTHVN